MGDSESRAYDSLFDEAAELRKQDIQSGLVDPTSYAPRHGHYRTLLRLPQCKGRGCRLRPAEIVVPQRLDDRQRRIDDGRGPQLLLFGDVYKVRVRTGADQYWRMTERELLSIDMPPMGEGYVIALFGRRFAGSGDIDVRCRCGHVQRYSIPALRALATELV